VAGEVTTEDDVSNQYFSLQNPSPPANEFYSCLPNSIIFMKPDAVPNFHMHLYLRLDGLLGCYKDRRYFYVTGNRRGFPV
jgi:hypothetical protein